MATVDSIMKTELVTATADETVVAVSNRMATNGVGAVLVLDDGRPVGLFSERDLLRRVVVPGVVPGAATVGEVMTVDPVCIGAEEHVKRAGELFREHGFRHLPVTTDGKAVGILSERDLMSFVVRGLEQFIDQARYEEHLREGVDPYDHLGGSYAR